MTASEIKALTYKDYVLCSPRVVNAALKNRRRPITEDVPAWYEYTTLAGYHCVRPINPDHKKRLENYHKGIIEDPCANADDKDLIRRLTKREAHQLAQQPPRKPARRIRKPQETPEDIYTSPGPTKL
jgi:hypothetical protein